MVCYQVHQKLDLWLVADNCLACRPDNTGSGMTALRVCRKGYLMCAAVQCLIDHVLAKFNRLVACQIFNESQSTRTLQPSCQRLIGL